MHFKLQPLRARTSREERARRPRCASQLHHIWRNARSRCAGIANSSTPVLPSALAQPRRADIWPGTLGPGDRRHLDSAADRATRWCPPAAGAVQEGESRVRSTRRPRRKSLPATSFGTTRTVHICTSDSTKHRGRPSCMCRGSPSPSWFEHSLLSPVVEARSLNQHNDVVVNPPRVAGCDRAP